MSAERIESELRQLGHDWEFTSVADTVLERVVSEQAAHAANGKRNSAQSVVSRQKYQFRKLLSVVAAVLILACILRLGFVERPAFAEVQRALSKLDSIAFFVEVLAEPIEGETIPGTEMVDLIGNRRRFESADGTMISVIGHGKTMILYPKERRADVFRNAESVLPSFADFLKSLRECNADVVTQLDNTEVDGRVVERFRVSDSAPMFFGLKTIVSVDPETGLLVRLECKAEKGSGNEPFHIVGRNFTYEPFDELLFSTVPPPGYQTNEDGKLGPVTAVEP